MTLRLSKPWATLFLSLFLIFGASMPARSPAFAAADDPYPRQNPLAGDESAIKEGRPLFLKWCAACHGPKADGVSRFGKYAADLRKYWRGYCDFIVIVLNGRPKRQMPPWGGVLDEEQIERIGAYLETLAIEGANWKGRCTLL